MCYAPDHQAAKNRCKSIRYYKLSIGVFFISFSVFAVWWSFGAAYIHTKSNSLTITSGILMNFIFFPYHKVGNPDSPSLEIWATVNHKTFDYRLYFLRSKITNTTPVVYF